MNLEHLVISENEEVPRKKKSIEGGYVSEKQKNLRLTDVRDGTNVYI